MNLSAKLTVDRSNGQYSFRTQRRDGSTDTLVARQVLQQGRAISWQSGPVTERSIEPSLGSIPISRMLTRSTSASGDDPGPRRALLQREQPGTTIAELWEEALSLHRVRYEAEILPPRPERPAKDGAS